MTSTLQSPNPTGGRRRHSVPPAAWLGALGPGPMCAHVPLVALVTCLLVFSCEARAAEAEPALTVHYAQGRLSVAAREVPLVTLMQVVAERTGMVVRMPPSLDEPVSVKVDSVPLMQALRRLLRGTTWVLIEERPGADAALPALRELRVYGPAGQGTPPPVAAVTPRPAGIYRGVSAAVDGAALEEAVEHELSGFEAMALRERLRRVERLAMLTGVEATQALGHILADDPHRDVRARALAALRDRDDDGVQEAIEHGLGDEDPAMRLESLGALVKLGGETAVPVLGQVIFGDDDPDLRLTAVRFLAQTPGEAALALLEVAARDGDEIVRAAARDALGMR